jgi:hypothetical protein
MRWIRSEAAALVGVGFLGAVLLFASLRFIASFKDPSPALGGLRWIPRAPSFVLVRLLDIPSRPGMPRTASGRPSFRKSSRSMQQQAIFDELLRRHEAHLLSVADRRVLARGEFKDSAPFAVKTRSHWPEGVPVRVTVEGRFAGLMPRELHATPAFRGGRAIDAYHGGVELVREQHSGQATWKDRPAYDPGLQSIGIPPAGSREVVFDTTIDEAGETIWEGKVAQAILVEGAIDDVLRPVDSPEVRSLMAAAVESSLRLNADCSRVVLVVPSHPAWTEIAMAVVVEFVHAEKVAASAVLRWRDPGLTAEQRDFVRIYRGGVVGSRELWAALSGELEGVRAADPTDSDWSVRVRGDGTTALEDYDSTMYWSGTITVPLDRVKRELAP